MVSCIIVAAGNGSRMQCKKNKILLKIGTKTVLEWTLQNILKIVGLEEIVLVVSEKDKDEITKCLKKLSLDIPIKITLGGKTRQESVFNGLCQVEKRDVVLVHDAARPLADENLCNKVVQNVREKGSTVPAVPVKDTIKIVKSDKVVSTPVRSSLRAVQTPQGFDYKLLKDVHNQAREANYQGTDDASLVEWAGHQVSIVDGSYNNIKLTTCEDLQQIKSYLGIKDEQYMRVGFGYDVHRFKAGRPCILGGVEIDSPIGPDGHSDADVLLHALMDALLGAAGLRDIGYYFPPTDDQYKGISSLSLLQQVKNLLMQERFTIINVDIMVIAECPKINPHIEAMKDNIAKVLDIHKKYISIKATTNEQLGALGRKEGIAAQAVATVQESEELQ